MLNPRKMQNIDLEFNKRQAQEAKPSVAREIEQSDEISGQKHVPPQEEQIHILPSDLADMMLDA